MLKAAKWLVTAIHKAALLPNLGTVIDHTQRCVQMRPFCCAVQR